MKLWVWVTAAVLSTGMAMADPVHGVWQTGKDDNGNYGHIQISGCGGSICGKLVKSFNSAGAPVSTEIIGRNIVWDMQPEGGGAYGGGKVWAPDRDKTYNSKMKLTGNKLAVSGCVLGICRDGGTWTRVN